MAAADDINDGPAPANWPHPGKVNTCHQYTSELEISRFFKQPTAESAKDDHSYHLQSLNAIQLIHSLRLALRLPVKTFDSACTFFHHFRLRHRESDYVVSDAAIACLFVACKVEDTLKKSREILCANYNLKNPDHPLTPDDKSFEASSKLIIGLERLVVESMAFDFRVRNAQSMLIKIIKRTLTSDEARTFYPIAWEMSLDMYKTYIPIKQTTTTMALAIVELTALVTNTYMDRLDKLDAEYFSTTRNAVFETKLDFLNLYTQHPRQTKVGQKYDPTKFINLKIKANEEQNTRTESLLCRQCEEKEQKDALLAPNALTSPDTPSTGPANPNKRGSKGAESTMRFVFDADEALREKDAVRDYTEDVYEEIEEEIEEVIPADRPREPRGAPRGPGRGGYRGHDSHWHGGYGGHGGHNDHGGQGGHGGHQGHQGPPGGRHRRRRGHGRH